MVEVLGLLIWNFAQLMLGFLIGFSLGVVYFVLILEVPDFWFLSFCFGGLGSACLALYVADIVALAYGLSYTLYNGEGARISKFTYGVVYIISLSITVVVSFWIYMKLLLEPAAVILEKLFS